VPEHDLFEALDRKQRRDRALVAMQRPRAQVGGAGGEEPPAELAGAPTKRHLARLVAVAHSGAGGVVLTFAPTTSVTSCPMSSATTPSPTPTDNASRL
jgi:hypothetical protein